MGVNIKSWVSGEILKYIHIKTGRRRSLCKRPRVFSSPQLKIGFSFWRQDWERYLHGAGKRWFWQQQRLRKDLFSWLKWLRVLMVLIPSLSVFPSICGRQGNVAKYWGFGAVKEMIQGGKFEALRWRELISEISLTSESSLAGKACWVWRPSTRLSRLRPRTRRARKLPQSRIPV